MEKVQSFYKKNTQLVYAVVCLLASFFIVSQIILPTLSSARGARQDLSLEQTKLDNYNASLIILKKVDDSTLSRQADIAVQAVPPSKDIQAIYLALTTSAAAGNVSVRGFTVKIGDIFQKGSQEKLSTTGVPFVLVNLQVSGADPASLYAFSRALSGQFPLSTIINASTNIGEGNMDIAFYYKPYDLSVINRDVVVPVSLLDQNILNGLSAAR